jgi:hypothetical protein
MWWAELVSAESRYGDCKEPWMRRRDFIAALAGAAVASTRAWGQTQPAPATSAALDLRAYRRIGSVAAGSNVLKFAEPTDFQTGDQIIVEVGGEEGKGRFGTVGVGGAVPRATDGWSQFYYRSRDLPLALIAKVIAVRDDGRTVILDKAAATAATNANIHFDNSPLLNALLGEGHAPGWALVLPAGDFAISEKLQHRYQEGWTIKGAGKGVTILRSPKGVPGSGIHCFEANRTEIADITIVGNAGQNGFGLTDHGNGWIEYGVGVLATKSSECLIHNVSCVDVFRKAVWAEYADGFQAHDCNLKITEPFRGYLEWWFGVSDSRNGTFTRCTINSKCLISGFELFRSDGTRFIDCGGRNASFSSNSSGNFLLDGFNLDITERAQFDEKSFHHLNPAVNINTNIQPPNDALKLGGTIKNIRIAVEGPIDARGNLLKGIVVNRDNPNVRIDGGLISYPDGVHAAEVGPFGVNSTGENTVVRGLTVTGRPANPWEANIYVHNGRIIQCKAKQIRVDSQPL